MQVFAATPEAPGGFKVIAVVQVMAIGPRGTVGPAVAGEPAVAWLLPWTGEGLRRGTVLIVRPGQARVNGGAALPVTVLRRGDEIEVGGARLYYTDEGPLRVVAFEPRAGGPATVECTRCHGTIGAGDPVVSCPVCGALYMAQPGRGPNCWEFGPCLSCGRDPKRAHVWQPAARRAVQPWRERPWRLAVAASKDREASHV
jgi:hypothetical protein